MTSVYRILCRIGNKRYFIKSMTSKILHTLVDRMACRFICRFARACQVPRALSTTRLITNVERCLDDSKNVSTEMGYMSDAAGFEV